MLDEIGGRLKELLCEYVSRMTLQFSMLGIRQYMETVVQDTSTCPPRVVVPLEGQIPAPSHSALRGSDGERGRS